MDPVGWRRPTPRRSQSKKAFGIVEGTHQFSARLCHSPGHWRKVLLLPRTKMSMRCGARATMSLQQRACTSPGASRPGRRWCSWRAWRRTERPGHFPQRARHMRCVRTVTSSLPPDSARSPSRSEEGRRSLFCCRWYGKRSVPFARRNQLALNDVYTRCITSPSGSRRRKSASLDLRSTPGRPPTSA